MGCNQKLKFFDLEGRNVKLNIVFSENIEKRNFFKYLNFNLWKIILKKWKINKSRNNLFLKKKKTKDS